MWLPPDGTACIDNFTVTATDITDSSANSPASQTVKAFAALYTDLTPGHVYEFTVTATGTAGGSSSQGASLSARVAQPPAFLDARPSAPELLNAPAVDQTSINVTWDKPAGNPKVESYAIKVTQVS